MVELHLDMIEEYARHVGHADLIRESVDGLVGEDPPDDWVSGGLIASRKTNSTPRRTAPSAHIETAYAV